jgi:D-beta-D-heptose 7-phosphate kinase/D-beta-D-heptose 1-phosphate adenosyltransferase
MKIRDNKILEKVGWNLMSLLNLDSLLITLGENGMALFERNKKITFIPAESKTVYDVTGAGDTVIASLTLSAAAGASMKDAAFIANVAAGIAVGRMGTARVSKTELREALKLRK